MKTTHDILLAAKEASHTLRTAATEQKNRALLCMAERLVAHTDDILAANAEDVAAARGVIADVMVDRLLLTDERIAAMAEGVRAVAALDDPVGEVLSRTVREDGLIIEKTAVPIGVIAIIYESRPNVTSDAAALALKSGNACVLRGGKEAFRSAFAITEALREGLRLAGLPENAVSMVEDVTRDSANQLMRAVGLVDLLIPRGGPGLIRACTENATVPCIQTGTGICHVYIDRAADPAMALEIIDNAKMSRPSVCNAAEVCLVHAEIAPVFLPMLRDRLTDPDRPHTAELRLDETARQIIDGTPASPDDFDTEFLDYILAVRVVGSIEEAVRHIAAHSTMHSEAIVTADPAAAAYFTATVDSSAVYVNASTRFTDGGEFGLGCEMGISTQKLHARGPMGLRELTTYKYIVTGNGHIR